MIVARTLLRLAAVGFGCTILFVVSPLSATVSGDDGRIAFVVDIEGTPTIHTMEPGGSDVRVLGPGTQPRWSPDGRMIAFVRQSGEVWVMGGDGSGQHFVTAGRDPSWSPDGGSIAVSRDSVGLVNGLQTSVIAVVDIAVSEVSILTDPGGWTDQAGNSTSTDHNPVWAADGEQITFVRHFAPATPISVYTDLMVVDVALSTSTMIIHPYGNWVGSLDVYPEGEPVLSIAKSTIATPPRILLHDASDGSSSTIPVPDGYGPATWASFAPSGDRIVATLVPLTAPMGPTLWTLGLDGSDPVRLGEGYDPSWQPVNPYPLGLVDVSQGEWHLRYPDGHVSSFYFGNPGDVPIMGDWDCDGVETPGLYRQSDGYVYLRNSNSQGIADIRFFFGNPDDVPLAGDFNKDGCDTVSVYRPSNATFYIINDLGENDGGLGAADIEYIFGNPGDKPFIGDFDGDGVDTPGLHRESTGLVYYRNWNSEGVADAIFVFGDPGDRFVTHDWNGDGTDSPGVFRPSTTTAHFRFTNTEGPADARYMFGESSWIPVTGNFAKK
jgi:hypothetical protein